ncbi:MAG: prepilin-type N-terminal cleavage/methylation domain-containing protein [Candidatus Lustribacter sp.]|jgi:prepilin-type N-terminal cleavage/methylation domain-containing protein
MRREAGFTLIEVMVATALFVFVAFAGFDVLRQLSWNAGWMAQRAAAAAQLDVAAGRLRSDALSAVAVWKPASACGDAVEFMQRNAGGTSFLLYLAQGGALVRAGAAGPLDPCDPALRTETVVAAIAGLTVTRVPAAALPAHADPVSGNADGGLFVPAGITAVAVDAHALDAGGTPILTGNDVVEVTIAADPVQTSVDLVAGNRPSAYAQVLTYTCNGRCEANGAFPEIRNAAFTDCAPGYDFQNSATYYVPVAYGYAGAGNGNQRIVVTAYSVTGGYTFAFAGPVPQTAERVWPVALWPPAGSPLAGTVADPYPVNYAANAVAARGAALIAADLGEPAAFASELTACADMHADPTFAGPQPDG